MGIEKYGGIIDDELQTLLSKAGLPYKPYGFRDGRMLLVNEELNFGFLYADKEDVFRSLVLSA